MTLIAPGGVQTRRAPVEGDVESRNWAEWDAEHVRVKPARELKLGDQLMWGGKHRTVVARPDKKGSVLLKDADGKVAEAIVHSRDKAKVLQPSHPEYVRPGSRVDPGELDTRDWAKWHAEHPYLRRPRAKKLLAKLHAEKPMDHAGGKFAAKDEEVMRNGAQTASRMKPGKVIKHGPVSDADYRAHRDHVERALTMYGSKDLEHSPFSTHNSEDRVNGDKGRYTEERRALHDRIIGEYMDRAATVPREHKGIIMGGLGGAGKALRLDEPVPTPSGWTTIGEISEGDSVFDAEGRPTTVLALSAIDGSPVSYRLTFDDGSIMDACADHQWLTFDVVERRQAVTRTGEWRAARREKRPRGGANRNPAPPPPRTCLDAPSGTVRTTKEIAATVRNLRGEANHGVLVTKALELPDVDLPIPPYVLGAWLGDGHSDGVGLTCADPEIPAQITAEGQPCRKLDRPYAWAMSDGVRAGRGGKPDSLFATLTRLGLRGNKHLPMVYLRASRAQRLAVLQGLMDTDGTVDRRTGKVSFTTTKPLLRDGFEELVLSLGWKTRAVEGRARINGRDCGPVWDFCFSPDEAVFRLSRKADLQQSPKTARSKFRLILSVEEVDPVPMRCLRVDSERGLFLAGRRFIVTHNSTILKQDTISKHLGLERDEKGDITNFLTINPDDIKERMAELGAIPKVNELSPMEASVFAHEEASELAKEVTRRVVPQGTNVIHDITLNSVKSGADRIMGNHEKRIEGLKAHGYKVAGVMVDVSTEHSLKSAEQRHRGGIMKATKGEGYGGRYVPSDLIRTAKDPSAKYRSVNTAAFHTLKEQGLFDHTIEVDNEGYAGRITSEGGTPLSAVPVGARSDAIIVRASLDQTPIEKKIEQYGAGEIPWTELRDYLWNYSYENPPEREDPGFNGAEHDDRTFMPGTFGEVRGAYADGKLTSAEYNEIANGPPQQRRIAPGSLDTRDWAEFDAERRTLIGHKGGHTYHLRLQIKGGKHHAVVERHFDADPNSVPQILKEHDVEGPGEGAEFAKHVFDMDQPKPPRVMSTPREPHAAIHYATMGPGPGGLPPLGMGHVHGPSGSASKPGKIRYKVKLGSTAINRVPVMRADEEVVDDPKVLKRSAASSGLTTEGQRDWAEWDAVHRANGHRIGQRLAHAMENEGRSANWIHKKATVMKRRHEMTKAWHEGVAAGMHEYARHMEKHPDLPMERNWAEWDAAHRVGHRPDFDAWHAEHGGKGEYDEFRQKDQAWQRQIRHGLAMGHISPAEAQAHGYISVSHESTTGWEPLPPHLYHVTTNHGAIVASGKLKSRDELEMGSGHGLGGGESHTISYTDDLETARTIKNAMLEARQVARGEITPADLLERARKGDKGSTPFLQDLVRGWHSQWNEGEELPQGIQALLAGKKIAHSALFTTQEEMNAEHPGEHWEPAPWADKIEAPKGTMWTHYWRDATPQEKAEDATHLYKGFSLWRSVHGGPEDPLFFTNDPQALADTKAEDIQIVHAKPKPGAMGYQVSALGEWRSPTGDNVEVQPETLRSGVLDLRKASGYALSPGSGMVSLDIAPGVLPRVPGGVDDHHITIVYLGKDVSDELLGQVSEIAQAVAARTAPLSGTLGGLGTFEPSEASDGKVPVYVKPDIPGIETLRPPFEQFNASQHKDFKPHATLAYVEPGDALPEPVPETPVTFTHLTVHRGNDVLHFPLTGGTRNWEAWDEAHKVGRRPRKAEIEPGATAGHKRELPAHPWVDPPIPKGTLKSGRKAGGWTAIGITNTALGDAVENALIEHMGMSNEHPDRRQGPLDLRIGDNGYECKAVSTSSTEYKAKPKKIEVEQKKAYAEAHGLKAHTMVVVYSPEEKRLYVYSKPGIGAYRLTSPRGGWTFHGTVPLDLGTNPDPAAVREAVELVLRNWEKWDEEHEVLDYHGQHTAPGPGYGDPMHDIGSNVMPKDYVDHPEWYGTGDKKPDAESFAAMRKARGNGEARITIHRAVPKHVTEINPGDWVTPSKTYAEQHAASGWGGEEGHVISKEVAAKELWTNGDSPNEWGWHPQSTRDWTEWDLEHRPLHKARQHIAENAKRFHDTGGYIETLNGREHGDQLQHIDRVELVELRKALVAANDGKPLSERAEKGFRLAHIAAASGRTNPSATIHIARTKEGHIAAIAASGRRGSLQWESHHLALMGSTGIAHGAGSALLQRVMVAARLKHKRVTLVPYDEDAARHWAGNLGAHEDSMSGDMGWTADEVKELAAA